MLCLLLFSVLVLGGAATNEYERPCPFRECGEIVPMYELIDLSKGEKELINVCPKLQEYFSCVRNGSVQCYDKTIEEFRDSVEERKARNVQFYLDLEEVATDLCNPDTELHTAFRRHGSCFKKAHVKGLPLCDKIGAEVIRDYREIMESSENDDEDKDIIPLPCLGGTHILACLVAVIDDECGQEARQTYQLIIKRSRLLRQILGCSPDHFNRLKSAFLEDLTVEGELRERLASYFDIMKRK